MAVSEKKPAIPLSMDWPLVSAALLLCLIGIVNLASAGAGEDISRWPRQLVALGIGVAAMAVISNIDYRYLNRSAYPLFAVTLLLAMFTLIFGREVHGTRAWIRIGSMSVQPSEFVKIGAILAMSKFFHDQRVGGPYGAMELRIPLVIIAISTVLIKLQPDTGTTVMLVLILGSIILFAGVRRYLIIGTVVFGLVSTPFVWKLLAPHQKDRVWTFINPESDPLGRGYNVIQSMVAVGSGEITGKGYRLGSQTALKYLPERHSDFAFSVLGEEWGFLGSSLVLILFVFIIIWALRIASLSRDRFGCLVGIGVAAMLFWHMTINIAMTLGAFPVMGIPLPFLSYGGSFLITTLAGIGMLMSIEGRRFMF